MKSKRPKIERSYFHPPSKDELLGLYMIVFVLPILLVVVGAAAFFAHDVFIPWLFGFVFDSIVDGATQMLLRPTLILAFALVLVFLWSIASDADSGNDSEVKRGRNVHSLSEAQRLSREQQQRRRNRQRRMG